MRTDRPHRHLIEAQRHIAALRAFHTGLIAETHRHLRVLQEMTQHIDVLRRPQLTPTAKLAAARETCRQLRALESLKRPWRETYRDFRRSLGRARALIAHVVRNRRPGAATAQDPE